MKNIFLLFFFLSVFLSVFGQTGSLKNNSNTKNSGTEIEVNAGYGSYLMSDLKSIQKLLIINSDIPLKVTTSFPEYYNYSIRFGHRTKANCSGFIAGLISTGARSSLSDYSGYIYSDIKCLAIYSGYYYQKEFYTTLFLKRSFDLGYDLNLSLIHSNVDMEDKLDLYDNSSANNDFVQSNNYTFNSIGIYTEPLIYARYMFREKFGIELNTGGALSLSTPIYYKKIDNYITAYNQKRFVNWSGFRVNIGLVYRF